MTNKTKIQEKNVTDGPKDQPIDEPLKQCAFNKVESYLRKYKYYEERVRERKV